MEAGFPINAVSPVQAEGSADDILIGAVGLLLLEEVQKSSHCRKTMSSD